MRTNQIFIKKIRLINLVCLTALLLIVQASAVYAASNPMFQDFPEKDGPVIKLILGDKTYEIQSYGLGYYRPSVSKTAVKERNHGSAIPPETPLLNNLTIGIKSSRIDQGLMDWILGTNQQEKNGQLIVSDGETGKVIRTITLENLKPSGYNESMTVMNNYGELTNQYTNLSLTYEKINIKF